MYPYGRRMIVESCDDTYSTEVYYERGMNIHVGLHYA